MTPRFQVESWGAAWVIIDAHSRTVVPKSCGELDSRVVLAKIMNLKWEEQCRKKLKVVPIR